MHLDGLNVIWVGKFTYEPNWHLNRHSHPFYHIIYIAGGRGIAVVDEKSYEISSEWLIVCPPECEHELTALEKAPLKTIEIKFDINNEEIQASLNSLERAFQLNSNDIRIGFETVVDDIVKQDFLYKEFLTMHTYSILLTLMRIQHLQTCSKNVPSKALIADSNYKNVDFEIILDYIDKNLGSLITLNDLSKQVQFNSSYLCRIFKNRFGISPIQYINNTRLAKAKELIMYSDLNITQITQMVGFSSIHYFSRYFKKKEGFTPLEYKKKVRNSFYLNL